MLIISLFSEDFLKSQYPEVHTYLRGIVSIDKIPLRLKKSEFVIINQSPSDHNGSHWFLLTKDIEGSYEVFDSLGIDRNKEILMKEYLPDKFCVIYNVSPYQRKDTNSCGCFVLYYLIHKFYNTDCGMHELLSKVFCKNLQKNELKVAKFLKHDFSSTYQS